MYQKIAVFNELLATELFIIINIFPVIFSVLSPHVSRSIEP